MGGSDRRVKISEWSRHIMLSINLFTLCLVYIAISNLKCFVFLFLLKKSSCDLNWRCHFSFFLCCSGDTESQAVPALPAEGWPVRGCGRIRLQRLALKAVHAKRNLPHHIPPCRWVSFTFLPWRSFNFVSSNWVTSGSWWVLVSSMIKFFTMSFSNREELFSFRLQPVQIVSVTLGHRMMQGAKV